MLRRCSEGIRISLVKHQLDQKVVRSLECKRHRHWYTVHLVIDASSCPVPDAVWQSWLGSQWGADATQRWGIELHRGEGIESDNPRCNLYRCRASQRRRLFTGRSNPHQSKRKVEESWRISLWLWSNAFSCSQQYSSSLLATYCRKSRPPLTRSEGRRDWREQWSQTGGPTK